MHLAKNIRFLRNKKGISQETLGELLGKSHKTVSSYESGQAELNLGMLGILKNYFGTSLDALVFSDLARMENSENLGVVAEPEVMVLGLAEIFTVGTGDGTEGPLEGGRTSITGLDESAIQANEAIAGT